MVNNQFVDNRFNSLIFQDTKKSRIFFIFFRYGRTVEDNIFSKRLF